jgi:hypothetical protein
MIVLNNRMLITNQLGLLAQLARAPALHAGGQRFESVTVHYLTAGLKGISKGIPFFIFETFLFK